MKDLHSWIRYSFISPALCILSLIFDPIASLGQVPTSITSSGLNTRVSAPSTLPSGQINYDITGGTRPGNGTNLFHSFGNFSVGSNNIANFLNETALPTTNILGRVTGGNVSNIFGTLRTTGFGTANLFLMNPAGFLFGPNATLNVGGMVTVTTADYMKLADGARFNAKPNAAADALLSTAPVAAFGFLGSNPGAIRIQGSQLSVANGTGISLVGGDIAIDSAQVSAPSGEISLVSVGKPQQQNSGEISAVDFSPSPTLGFSNFGPVTVTNGAIISASTDGITVGQQGGTIRIRAGELVVSNSTVAAEGLRELGTFPFPIEMYPPGGNIDIHAQNVALDHATISTSAYRSKGGPITFSELENLHSFNSTIEAIALGGGLNSIVRGGSIEIGAPTTKNIVLTDTTVSSFVVDGFLEFPPGKNSGDITLTGKNLLLDHSTLDTNAGPHSAIPPGIITLNGDQITLRNDTLLQSRDTTGGSSSGTIVLQGLLSTETAPADAKSITIDGSLISLRTLGVRGGTIAFHANQVTLTNATLSTSAVVRAGTINLADVGTLKSTNSILDSVSFGGEGGTILLGSLTTESITLNDTTVSVWGQNGGTINIMANRLFNSVGSTFDASGVRSGVFDGSPPGNGGTISIRGKQGLQLTNSTLTTSNLGGPDTNAGHITLESNLVKLENSQVLSTATEGQGGTIAITTPKYRADSSSVLDVSSQTGTDGTVTITKP